MSEKLLLPLCAALLLCGVSLRAQEMVSTVAETGLKKTISYHVEQFTDVRDKKLVDVMMKMPGLSVMPGFGMISYNGMFVSTIYVNGIDMVGSDYETVFNMKPEDVDRLEITENHVDIKIMEGLQYSGAAGINVILKDGAGSWSGAVKAGLGAAPLLYSGEAHAMNIGSKTQTSIVLKADNTGQNLGSTLGSTTDFSSYGLQEFLDIHPSLAPLSEERVRQNNSLFGNVNNTFRLSDDYQLNLQLSLHSDRLHSSSYDETTYFFDQGSLTNASGEQARLRQRDINASLSLLANTAQKYLRNDLTFTSRWNEVSKSLSGFLPSEQAVTTRPLDLVNSLTYKFPVGRNVLSINWETAYISKPQTMLLDREPEHHVQSVHTRTFNTDLSASYNLSLGRFTLAFTAGAAANRWLFDSQLSPIPEIQSRDNDSELSFIKGYGMASATYLTDKLQIQLSLPANFYHYAYEDALRPGEDSARNKFYFSPMLSVKYEVNSNLSLSGSLSSMDQDLNRWTMFTGMVLCDFQSVSTGIIDYTTSNSKSASLSFSYRHPATSFFLNGSAMRTWGWQAQTTTSDLVGNYIITQYIPDPNRLRTTSDNVSLSVSRGINALRGKVGLSLSYFGNRSALSRNEVLIPYSSGTYTVGPNINGRLLNWCNMIYSLNYSYTDFRLNGRSPEESLVSTTHSLTQSLELIFTPWQKFNFSFLGEHYMNQLTDDQFKNLVLVDFKAEYDLNERWQLIASVTNILNQDTYDYKLINSMMAISSYTSYHIRPRNFLLSLYFKF